MADGCPAPFRHTRRGQTAAVSGSPPTPPGRRPCQTARQARSAQRTRHRQARAERACRASVSICSSVQQTAAPAPPRSASACVRTRARVCLALGCPTWTL